MSDPRNVAHAKKVTQEKKHHGPQASTDAPPAQPGKKSATARKKKGDPVSTGAADTPAGESAAPSQTAAPVPSPPPPAALEGSLVVLAQLKDLEFHSRANLERLATLTMTVGDELKQKEMVSPLDEVYSAQSALQTKLTVLIEAYKAECERMQG